VIKGRYTQSSDYWSSGVLLFIFLCGKPPFWGRSEPEIMRKVTQGVYSMEGGTWPDISENAKQLVRSLLLMDPATRCTGAEALGHAWMNAAQATAPIQSELSPSLLKNLKRYRANNALTKAALQLIAWRVLPDDQMRDLGKVFQSLDADGNGMLSLDEVSTGFQRAGLEEVPQDLQEIVEALDSNGNGMISHTDFVAATLDRQKLVTDEAYRTVFRLFDKNGDGKISVQELKDLLDPEHDNEQSPLDAAAFEIDIQELMTAVDTDGDGAINFPEFVQMMQGVGSC
jgi:calcium-dependent protein kinase